MPGRPAEKSKSSLRSKMTSTPHFVSFLLDNCTVLTEAHELIVDELLLNDHRARNTWKDKLADCSCHISM